jgi:5-methylcytosine-specific restriction endonuclease McrA
MQGPLSEPQCWQLEHFCARHRGGNNVLGNVLVSCSTCHKRKHSNPQDLLPIVIELRSPARPLTIERREGTPKRSPPAPDGHTLADLYA